MENGNNKWSVNAKMYLTQQDTLCGLIFKINFLIISNVIK